MGCISKKILYQLVLTMGGCACAFYCSDCREHSIQLVWTGEVRGKRKAFPAPERKAFPDDQLPTADMPAPTIEAPDTAVCPLGI